MISLLMAIGLAACSQKNETRDDDAVLRAVLERICQNDSIHLEIVSNRPATFDNPRFPAEWPLAPQYRRQLSARSTSTGEWAPGEICEKVRFVPPADIAATFAADVRVPPGWEKFFEAFKGAHGYVAYSRPVYSDDGKHAAILLRYHCPDLCGGSFLLELDWAEGRWSIARYASQGVS